MGQTTKLRPVVHGTRPVRLQGYDALGRRLPCSYRAPAWAYLLPIAFGLGFAFAEVVR